MHVYIFQETYLAAPLNACAVVWNEADGEGGVSRRGATSAVAAQTSSLLVVLTDTIIRWS